MRIIIVFILLAFGLRPSADNSQQSTDNRLCAQMVTSRTVPELVEGTTFGASTSSATEEKTQRLNDAKTQSEDSASLRLCDFASFHEYQISKADSLYKNYLPQYNFDEVKAAMEFFDSCQLSAISGQRWRLFGKEADDGNRLIAESRQLTAAKAHYYHAVGLTEKDDIVGACEHYLIALEIMEPLVETHRRASNNRRAISADNPEDYEKIRFVALIYTRLGELFLSKDYYEISLKMFHQAHLFIKLCHGKMSEVNVLKSIGNAYQLSNNLDSALFYYNKSLELNPNAINKLDLEKSIALILFEKGERDSAYRLIRNNLNKTDNYVAKYSYYLTLSRILYRENKCDSAITYLKLSINAPDKHTRLMASTYLSDIFDSIGDDNQKYYYDSIALSILSKNHNNSIDVTKLQEVYSKYTDKKQKNERKKTKLELQKHLIKFAIAVLVIIIILLIFIFIIQYKKKKDKMIYETRLLDKEFEIIEKKEEIEKIAKTNDDLNAKLENIKSEESLIITENNIIEYYNCDICKRILSEISNIENKNLKINNIASLSKDDLLALEMSANLILNGYIQHIQMKYPTLKKQDINCICLSILNINEPTMASLLGKSYNAVWSRMRKIRAIMNIKSNAELLYV